MKIILKIIMKITMKIIMKTKQYFYLQEIPFFLRRLSCQGTPEMKLIEIFRHGENKSRLTVFERMKEILKNK